MTGILTLPGIKGKYREPHIMRSSRINIQSKNQLIFRFELPSAEHDGNDNSEWFESRPEEPFNPLKVFTHEQIMSGLRNAISNWKKSRASRFGEEFETRPNKARKRGNTIPISPKLATRVSGYQIFYD